MTEYAEKKSYSLYGSLAYAPERTRNSTAEGYQDIAFDAAPYQGEEVEVVARSEAKTVQAVAPLAIVGFLVAAALLVFALFAQIKLTTVSDEAVQLQNRLEELQTEQTRLQIRYESEFNFNEIEKYALEELGMQKPRSDQIYYVNGSVPDKAVVYTETEEGGSFLNSIQEILSLMGEYFR